MAGVTIWRYRRRFRIGSTTGLVTLRSRSDGLFSELSLDGKVVSMDATPAIGPDAVRNHRLSAPLPDGSLIEVEAGYISSVNVGIAVRRDGELIHESHPGKTIAYPAKYRDMVESHANGTVGDALSQGFKDDAGEHNSHIDFGAFKRNRIPLAVDILLGLLFFVVAKLTDLTTAALVGAAVGVALLVAQRLTKIDLLGGLALFGIALLLLSAGLALVFQSDDAVKYRSSVVGLVSASLFFFDGVAGGNRLAVRLKRYLPYRDIDAARLGIGMGVLGAIMAGLNLVVAFYGSTDFWLFYSTFADFFVTMVLILTVFRYAQGKMLRDVAPVYREPPSE
ncbi:septation protein IspZ [Qipengyuania sp. XHP0207]|uniref:septation protein IspZ n=1 Tax=Qipengyuania sp. XHP0207 TaxID=3038078 RepID=UPI00241E3F16|nr:septation protein IspZ [Qipengyuania sp. XHP0207]MDG5747246.1 septation protein IspZ [Qipengyuania sp. XHP0207]